MEVKFKYNAADASKPIVFDQIFAEKVGGGVVANTAVDLVEGTAVGLNSDGKFAPIKSFFVYEDATNSATTIKILKNSGVVKGDILSNGTVAVACTAVDDSHDEYDIVSVKLTVAVTKGDELFAAKEAATTDAVPLLDPLFLLGQDIPANSGDVLAKLVNGANVRKETAPVADALVKKMKGITKI